jgi:hypothetical protein
VRQLVQADIGSDHQRIAASIPNTATSPAPNLILLARVGFCLLFVPVAKPTASSSAGANRG